MGLNKVNLGLSAGIVWGVALFVMTLISVKTGYAHNFLGIVSDIYPGYRISASGSIIGLAYGFVDGFSCLFVVAWIYNKLGKGK